MFDWPWTQRRRGGDRRWRRYGAPADMRVVWRDLEFDDEPHRGGAPTRWSSERAPATCAAAADSDQLWELTYINPRMQERYPKMRNLTRIARMCSARAMVAGIECTLKNSSEVLQKGMAKSRSLGSPLVDCFRR
jgi:hypothetical protein